MRNFFYIVVCLFVVNAAHAADDNIRSGYRCMVRHDAHPELVANIEIVADWNSYNEQSKTIALLVRPATGSTVPTPLAQNIITANVTDAVKLNNPSGNSLIITAEANDFVLGDGKATLKLIGLAKPGKAGESGHFAWTGTANVGGSARQVAMPNGQCVRQTQLDKTWPTNVVCNVKDPQWPWPKPSEFKISFGEPTVTHVDYILEDGGSYKPTSEDLITATKVSSWKADRNKCQIASGFRKGEFVNNYDFTFSCKGLEGGLSIDFSDNTGSYSERLTGFNTRRTFPLENCRADN